MEYQSEGLRVIHQDVLFFHVPSSFHSLTFSIRITIPSLLLVGMLLTFITNYFEVLKKNTSSPLLSGC